MAKLISVRPGNSYPIITRTDRPYVVIGRSREADIRLPGDCRSISAFHATIFRYTDAFEDSFYVIDHSSEGTYCPVDAAGPVEAEISHSEWLGHAHLPPRMSVEPKARVLTKDDPSYIRPIPGFVPHKYRAVGDMAHLRTMLDYPENMWMLISMGSARKLLHETQIAFGQERYVFVNPRRKN